MRLTATISLTAVAILAICYAAPLLASQASSQQSPSPSGVFAGDWTANIEKSQRYPKYQFQSSTLRFVFAPPPSNK
jgi:hypothetical protein